MTRGHLSLWERTPAERFSDAHMLGNGRLGATVFGTIPNERVLLNEDTLWSGSEYRHTNPGARECFQDARNLVREGKYREAANLIETRMLGTWNQSYQPLGNLWISLNQGDDRANEELRRLNGIEYANYIRCLDLEAAVETVEYDYEGHHYAREYFVSHPDQMVLIRLSCDTNCLDFHLSFNSEIHSQVHLGKSELIITGRAPDHVEPNYSEQKPPVMYFPDDVSDSIRFAAIVRILDTDGAMALSRCRLYITGATYAVIGIAAQTNYAGYRQQRDKDRAKIVDRCRRVLSEAATATYEALRDAHVRDYQTLFKRVSLEISPAVTVDLPTSKRMALQSGKLEDPSLSALALQYARYLLISASRPGTQAANLQGIWNQLVRPPWSSNYTTNINVQMNYWPAETLNLTECHAPLFDLISEIADSGKWTAAEYYGLNGWTSNHNVDLWRATIPASGLASWAYWPMAGGWLCQHLWSHFEFTGDQEFLQDTLYPLTMGAAKFLLGFLFEDEEGYLSTAPSTSPETNFFVGQMTDVDEDLLLQISAGNRMGQFKESTSSVCKSSTMDMTIIREVFEHCLKAADILGKRTRFHAELEDALGKLYPFKIGRHGQLQEWSEDFAECAPGMSHVSHMYGLYPGSMFTPDRNPELYEACRKSMMRRFMHGGHRGGWPGSWAMCLFARLKENFACGLITTSVFRRLGANMLTSSSFQIDCIYGIGAGVAEMLLQSHNGYIELLPSLPLSWTDGRYSGFRAVGGFQISVEWQGRKPIHATVTSLDGNVCRLRASGLRRVTSAGAMAETSRIGSDLIEFDTERGEVYDVLP